MQLFISESAFSDLQEIMEYYSEQGVAEIGVSFVDAIFEHIETLKEHPDIGRIVAEFNEEYIREIIHLPFRVVYLREVNYIQVIRVWRSERLLALPEDEL